MTGKSLKVNSNVLVLLVLLECAISMESESCPPGKFYFNNSTQDETTLNVNITTTIIPGANCYNCSTFVLLCDHCIYNHTRVVCLNCTDDWLPNTEGSACLRRETSDKFPWWGGLLIALTIVGVVLGVIWGFWRWNNKEDQDLPEPLPEPDGRESSFKKVNEEEKKKRNSYIKDPSRSVQRIPPSIYGPTKRHSQEGSFSNSQFTEVKQNVERGVIPEVDPEASGGQGQDLNSLYENFSGRGGGKNTHPDEIEMSHGIYMNT